MPRYNFEFGCPAKGQDLKTICPGCLCSMIGAGPQSYIQKALELFRYYAVGLVTENFSV